MMPKFKPQQGTKKYDDGTQHVKAPVIIIKSTLQDAPYLKTLLNYGYETDRSLWELLFHQGYIEQQM
eukprot:7100611-Ditylum_brightwellii.AAC.1